MSIDTPTNAPTTDAPGAVPDGRRLLEAIAVGAFPAPAAAVLVGIDLLEVDDGRTLFGFTPDAAFDNAQGAVNGGVLAVLADFAVSTSLMTRLPLGPTVSTTNLNVTYVRPVPVDGPVLRAEGRVLHLGRTLAHTEATVVDDQGRRYLHATATLHVQR